MAVKTITIDMEAYRLLAGRKKESQSFSGVIKEHFGRHPTAAAFRAVLRNVHLSDSDAMDRQVDLRRTSLARAAKR